MSVSDDIDVVPVTGDDVILWNGCSEEWVSWTFETIASVQDDDGEVVVFDILLLQRGQWTAITDWEKSIERQLAGGDPIQINPQGTYEYKFGFSTEDAREMLRDIETVKDFGGAGHNIRIPLSMPKAKKIGRILRHQYEERKA